MVATRRQMRLAATRQRALLTAQVRVATVLGLFAFGFLAIIARLSVVMVLGAGEARNVQPAYLPARADLVDRNREPLARTIKALAVRVVPDRMIGEPEPLARQLAAIFPDTPAAEFRTLLERRTPTYLRRRVLPEEANRIHALGEVGFDFPREDERFYPEHSLAAHVIGFVDANGSGRMGMEAVLDDRLTDADRRSQAAALSIDKRVQAALEQELGGAMQALNALGAAGVVLDVRTGELLALASLPAYNPNKLGPDINALVFNKVTNQVYELGSTFKPLTFAAALDAGVVTDLSRRYDATQPLRLAGFQIRDSHPAGRWLNVPEALIQSSNIVTAQVADRLGPERLERTMRQLGFHERPHIELAERGHPLWPASWGRLTNMTVSYGHGIAVTPLHLASAYAALVNGGIWHPATLLRQDGPPPPGRRVFKASTSATMRQLLRMIVADGTGRNADAPGFRVGGKTGSAEKPGAGGYRRHSVVATFAAAFPMDDPRYVVVVMLDEPEASAASSYQRTAGWTAAPVVARLVPRIGPMLGVTPDDDRDVDVSEIMPLIWKPKGER